ncbi:unannotated protein [freshwater metagenome]|uniref:Unannotated protein n=1 Tax=freshwater metagenome TaxID=449393 RepID=A0A6J7HT31_9ZZZZ
MGLRRPDLAGRALGAGRCRGRCRTTRELVGDSAGRLGGRSGCARLATAPATSVSPESVGAPWNSVSRVDRATVRRDPPARSRRTTGLRRYRCFCRCGPGHSSAGVRGLRLGSAQSGGGRGAVRDVGGRNSAARSDRRGVCRPGRRLDRRRLEDRSRTVGVRAAGGGDAAGGVPAGVGGVDVRRSCRAGTARSRPCGVPLRPQRPYHLARKAA